MLLTLLVTGPLFAGGAVTQEYGALRQEVYVEAHKDYNECVKSLTEPKFEEAYNNCIAEGRYFDTADGCIHEAASKSALKLKGPGSLEICEQYLPSNETMINRADQLAKERNIKKYK